MTILHIQTWQSPSKAAGPPLPDIAGSPVGSIPNPFQVRIGYHSRGYR